MKILPSLLGSIVLPRAASLPLRSRAAEAAPLPLYARTPQILDVQLMLDRMSHCRADAGTCPNRTAINHTDLAIKAINNTMNSVNKAQRELDIIMFDLAKCHPDKSGFLKSFDDRVTSHKNCRIRQISARNLHESCVSLRKTQESLADSTCTSGILGENARDLQVLCKPAAGMPVGPWLQAMMATFNTKYAEWKAAQDVCTHVTNQFQSTAKRCVGLATDLESQTRSCNANLASLESFACSHAEEHALKCRGYHRCYTTALAKYEAKVAALPGEIKRWRQAVVDAEQVKCNSNAVDSSGNIDAAKLEVCRNASLVDTSRVSVTIAKAPAKQSCSDPRIFPGSSLYRTRLYSSLPAGIKIREPVLCLGWKGGCAAHSTFDQFNVFLKYNGQYCDVQTTGGVVCNGKQGTFRFQQESTLQCGKGKVKLVTEPSGQACRYDPLAGLPSLSCGAHSVAGTPDFSATLSSNELASDRKGRVILAFAGASVKSLTDFGTLTRTGLGVDFNRQCSNGGKRGAFRGVDSWHDNGSKDRIFDWKCAYTPAGFSGFQGTDWSGWTGWYTNWQRECGSNEVITQVLSNRKVKDQCRLTVWDHHRSGRSESWVGPTAVSFRPNEWVPGRCWTESQYQSRQEYVPGSCSGWWLWRRCTSGYYTTRGWWEHHQRCSSGYEQKIWPNDHISSLEVTGGDHCRATLYEHFHYGGGAANFGRGYHSLSWNNDWASSVKVWDEGWVNDRQYNVMCGKTPQGMSLDARSWTRWTNTYNNPSAMDCGADAVLIGIKSENNNNHQDRIWAYRCASVSVMAPRQLDFTVEYAAE